DFPDIANERWHCIMAAAATKAIPLALENLCDALRLNVAKDMEGRKHTLALSKPDKSGKFDRSEEALQRVREYCEIDIETERLADKALGPLPDDEQGYRI